jgi:hypothetical protein
VAPYSQAQRTSFNIFIDDIDFMRTLQACLICWDPDVHNNEQLASASHRHATPVTKLDRLYNRISNSRDRLFFISHEPFQSSRPLWHLVQIQLDKTNRREALSAGKYIAHGVIHHVDDSTSMPVKNCRCWPKIHKLQQNNMLGWKIMVRPQQVNSFLNHFAAIYIPYELRVHLLMHRWSFQFSQTTPKQQLPTSHCVIVLLGFTQGQGPFIPDVHRYHPTAPHARMSLPCPIIIQGNSYVYINKLVFLP